MYPRRDPHFASPTGTVLVDAPTDLLDLTAAQAPDWPVGDGELHVATVTSRIAADGSARFHASTYEAPDVVLPPGLLAANGLIGTVIGAFVAADPAWICLHAAAVRLPGDDGRLTVLLGDTMAGKSTLAIALAALGQVLWCDDRLPVSAEGEGFALALRPKLRLPLPGSAPAPVRDLIAEHGDVREGEMIYLDLSGSGQAVFGARLPVSRLIVLDRIREVTVPQLTALPVATTVKHMVPVTFAPHLDPVMRLRRLRDLAGKSTCERLSYGDSFRAAAFLLEGANR